MAGQEQKILDSSKISLRPVLDSEQQAAIAVWNSVFDQTANYFERYYASDPWYLEGDTLGAWDGDRLVSTVHVCRRPLTWTDGRALTCGGIANVATLPEYRGRGLSRQLLEAAVRHMEKLGMHFSMLWTGYHSHYRQVGWETVEIAHYDVTLAFNASENSKTATADAKPITEVRSLYASSPRLLQLERPQDYFESWVGPRWSGSKLRMVLLPDKGYAIVDARSGAQHAKSASILEFRALDASAERAVLLEAIKGLADNAGLIRFHALPQFVSISDIDPSITGVSSVPHTTMLRNIALDPAEYGHVRDEYESGRAAWWPADHF